MKKTILSLINCLLFISSSIEANTHSIIESDSLPSSDTISDMPDRFFQEDDKTTLKDNYFIVYDGLYDMYGTAQTLFTVNRLFARGLDEITCRYDKYKQEYKCLDSESYMGRLFIDGLLNLLFVNWMSTIQHEFNGHGFRVREFEVPVNKYYVNPGMLSDKGRVDFNFYDLPLYGRLLYASGGPESNTIFSREAFRYGLQKESFSHSYLYSYLLKLDLPMYILGGTEVGSYNWENGYGDVVKYCMTFDEVSDLSMLDAYHEARKGAFISLMDPSLILSLFNYFRDYVIKGNVLVKSPMINVKHFSFLPFIDFHLSPYGFEYYAGSYLKVDKSLLEPYYRWSYGHQDGHSYGFGLSATNLIQYKNISLSTFFDFWHQDFNLIYYDSNSTKYFQAINSGKVALKIQYFINNTFNVSGQFGYKGEGFLMGNPIDKGYSYKFGIGVHF